MIRRMKHITLVFGGLIMALAPGLARAQGGSGTIKVNIPFEFKVGKSVLPAGEYSLVRPTQHYLQLRDASGRALASTLTNRLEAADTPATPTLRFYVVDGQHVLAEVWEQGSQSGEQVYPAESKEIAMAGGPSHVHEKTEDGQP